MASPEQLRYSPGTLSGASRARPHRPCPAWPQDSQTTVGSLLRFECRGGGGSMHTCGEEISHVSTSPLTEQCPRLCHPQKEPWPLGPRKF